jgi:predicted small secreted protein
MWGNSVMAACQLSSCATSSGAGSDLPVGPNGLVLCRAHWWAT